MNLFLSAHYIAAIVLLAPSTQNQSWYWSLRWTSETSLQGTARRDFKGSPNPSRGSEGGVKCAQTFLIDVKCFEEVWWREFHKSAGNCRGLLSPSRLALSLTVYMIYFSFFFFCPNWVNWSFLPVEKENDYCPQQSAALVVLESHITFTLSSLTESCIPSVLQIVFSNFSFFFILWTH